MKSVSIASSIDKIAGEIFSSLTNAVLNGAIIAV